MAVKPFVLIVADHDKKEFCIEGPMTNDDPWNEQVVKAQRSGREVNCSTPVMMLAQMRKRRLPAMRVSLATRRFQPVLS